VFFTVLIYGIYKNGLKFFSIFVPTGVPIDILPLVMFIEILSFFLRRSPRTASVCSPTCWPAISRLKVFAGFVAMPGFSLGALGWAGGVLPLALTVALTALELLVAFLQGLRVRDPDLHLPHRRHSSGTLNGPGNFHPHTLSYLSRSSRKWNRQQQNLSARASHASGMGGAGVGVGVIFGNYLAAAVRNPSAAQGQFGNLIFGFAVTEALGISRC